MVSKEMYYNITTDLKEIFQTTKDSHEKKDMACVDCDEEKAKEVHVPAAPVTGAEQPSGFTFSFFDSDTKDVKEGIFFFFFYYFTLGSLNLTESMLSIMI